MISVVIPVRDQAHWLGEAVESVWTQDIPDLEVVVVDDGSSDDVATALRDPAKSGRLRMIRQERRGAAAARNRGILESQGKWIAFLDADDYWLPGKLKLQLGCLEATGGRDVFAYCGTLVVDGQGRTLESRPATPAAGLVESLLWGNQIATPTVIAPSRLLKQAGLFDETLVMGEDWDLWLRLAARSPATCVSEPLVAVRFSTWESKGYRIDEFENATLRILTRFFGSLPSTEAAASLRTLENRVLSWHLSVLAKTHLRNGDWGAFLRCAARSVLRSPAGLSYLLRRRLFGGP